MYQNLTLIGNLGGDPVMKYTPSRVAVADFSLAVNRSWTGQDGQQQTKTIWFKVSCWNKLAETVTQYLTKGRLVLVVGEIEEARAFTDRDSNLRASLEVKANSVRFLGKTEGGMPATQASNPNAELNQIRVQDEEDLPF